MSENSENVPKIATEFSNVTEYNSGINTDGYARYNYKELQEREIRLTNMIEGASDVALFNSGAAAMHTTVEAEGLKTGDVVFCAEAIYSTTKSYIEQLKSLGIKIVYFDSSDMQGLQDLAKKEKPRLIIAESVANSPQMEVVNLAGLGALTKELNTEYTGSLNSRNILNNYISKREELKLISFETQDLIMDCIEEYRQGQNPFVFRQAVRSVVEETTLSNTEALRELSRMVKRVIGDGREKLTLIIDNTLPSAQLLNPVKILKQYQVEFVVVESGTKHYQEGANEITLGLAYSDNKNKIQTIKTRRSETGTYLQPNDEQKIPDSIHETMPDIMKKHAHNALQLAQILDGIPGFEVSHPNLPGHKQSDLVHAFAPEGIVSLFYVVVPEQSTGTEFMNRMKDLGGNLVGLGSSFGHAKTWISNYGMDPRTVRIAAGSETDISNLVGIFQQVGNEMSDAQK